MTVARVKGDRGKADVVFSRIVRSRGTCVRCGRAATDTAHVIPRRYSVVRCNEDNAWALCRSCHRVTGDHAGLHMRLVERTIGEPRYWELYALAQLGIRNATGLTPLMFWRGELTRLLDRYDELGIAGDWPALPKTWRST